MDQNQTDLSIFERFSSLDEERQEEIKGHPRLAEFSDRAKEVYLYLVRAPEAFDGNPFYIPSMVMARMLRYEMSDSRNVTNSILKKHGGEEGINWKHLSGALVFKRNDNVAFKIPGTNGEIFRFVKTRGNHKYPFLTLPFTRFLALRGSTSICKELASMSFIVSELLAEALEERNAVFDEIKGVKQTHPRWQALRDDSKAMTKKAHAILCRIGNGPELAMKINQILNDKIAGLSSSEARKTVEGMRKGETVRNVLHRTVLSEFRNVQDQFTCWLEERDEEGIDTTRDEVMDHLAQLLGERKEALVTTRSKELLVHPRSIIRMNGSINPSGYNRAKRALEDDPSTPIPLLTESKASKRRRLENAPKPNPFAKYGFTKKTTTC